jgi:hypothetical protein
MALEGGFNLDGLRNAALPEPPSLMLTKMKYLL